MNRRRSWRRSPVGWTLSGLRQGRHRGARGRAERGGGPRDQRDGAVLGRGRQEGTPPGQCARTGVMTVDQLGIGPGVRAVSLDGDRKVTIAVKSKYGPWGIVAGGSDGVGAAFA